MSRARVLSALRVLALHAILVAIALLTLVPFAYLAASALRDRGPDTTPSLFLPPGEGLFGVAWDELTLANFERLFAELDFVRPLANSIFLSGVTGILATLACAMGGYALAIFRFRLRTPILLLVLAALIIPPPLLLAPTYQLLFHLGLLDTYLGLILPAIAPAFGVFLFRQAMLGAVPIQLVEAARIDGCGELRIFASIALPLVKPMVGAFLLLSFLGVWNNFLAPQVILQSPEKFPLAVALAQLKGLYGNEYGLVSAGALVSAVPVAILFLLLQRDFISGLTSGAVKG